MRMRLQPVLVLFALIPFLPAPLAAQERSPLLACVAAADSQPASQAIATCREALAYYDTAGRTPPRARIHSVLGGLFRAQRQLDSAAAHYEQARLFYHRMTYPAQEGTALNWRGVIASEARQPDSAAQFFGEALPLLQQAGDTADQALSLRWLGALARWRGAHLASLDYYQRSRNLYAALGREQYVRAVSRELGEVYALRQLPDSAIPLLERALAPGPALSDSANEQRALRQLADLYVESAAPDSLIRARRGALALLAAGSTDADTAVASLSRSMEDPDSTTASNAGAWLGMVEQARGREAEAIIAYRSAIQHYPGGGNRLTLGILYSVLGSLHQRTGRTDSMSANYRLSAGLGVSTVPSPALLLMVTAGQRLSAGEADSAVELFRQAERAFAATGDHGLRNIARLRLQTFFQGRGQLDSAMTYARLMAADYRRLAVPEEEAFCQMLIASLSLQQSAFDSALSASERGLLLAPTGIEPRVLALLRGTRGTVFALTGHFDSALVNHRSAVAAWARAGDAYRRDAAQAVGHLGDLFRMMGQYDSALAYHRAQHADAPEGTAGELIVLRELALDFEALGVRDSALAWLRRREAAARWRRANTTSDPEGDALAEAESIERIGQLLEAAGDRAGADSAWRAAITSYRSWSGPWTNPDTPGDVGALYDRIGEPDSAIAWHRRSLVLARTRQAVSAQVRSLSAIGWIESRRGERDAGLANLRQALELQRSRGALESSAMLLGSIAFNLRRPPAPELPAALAALDTAAALRARVRLEAGGDDYRLGVAEGATLPDGEWEQAWLQYGDAGDMERAGYAALAASERGRAQALLDLMLRTARDVSPGADLAAEGRRLVTAATRGGVALLSYLVTDDTLLVWHARPIGGRVRLAVHRVPVPADSLARLVERWRAALGVDRVELGSRLAADGAASVEEPLRTGVAGTAAAGAGSPFVIGEALARLVLPEELRRGTARGELVIVPGGALAVIPFAALPVRDSATLGQRHALRYAPSVASLVEVERRPALPVADRAARLRRALVVGDPAMPSIMTATGALEPLRPLPAARREGEEVARRLGTRALAGAGADEHTVRQQMAGAPLIHLATHGYAYASGGQARRSFVALAPDSLDDGLLTVGEVLDDPALALSADLVVLSACQTGLGNLRKAEGTVGLQRAFLARGARTLLVSLWSVSDDATALLMQRFYGHWLEDADHPSKAEALRRAQEEVRRTPGFEAPRFWAPFQVVGGR